MSRVIRLTYMFQHTAARRRLASAMPTPSRLYGLFQHTAARRRLALSAQAALTDGVFQHTAARRRLVKTFGLGHSKRSVSTHNRPKAAGLTLIIRKTKPFCFNTQPPKGGWRHGLARQGIGHRFNTQPPKGGWAAMRHKLETIPVSTHSRLKAAGTACRYADSRRSFQHTAA